MRLLTVTSDSYVHNTCLLLASVRHWHAELPVSVYALDTGWSAKYEELLKPYQAEIHVVSEQGNTANRTSWSGGGVHNAYKLDVFLDQREPFLFLDSDMLALRPLDHLFAYINEHGWLTCHDGVLLHEYANGPISKYVTVKEADGRQRGFNSGTLGCDPHRHREILQQARDWVDMIDENFQGDQGLLNLAWYVKRGCVPPNADNRYNGGWREDDRIEMRNTIIHFARRNYGGAAKLRDQQRVWEAWPKDVVLTDLIDTDFWRNSLPHPWPWINQCNQRKYRGFVHEMRKASRTLMGIPGLFIEDADQAFLLDAKVIAEQSRWWAAHAIAFKDLPHKPTYHLRGGGLSASRRKHRMERWRRWIG